MNIAVILAGGVGARMGLSEPKQFLKIAGKTVLEHTVDVFQRHALIDEIAVVIHPHYMGRVEEMRLRNRWTKVKKILDGGSERYESSLTAIRAYGSMGGDNRLIFHDAVRPLVSKRIIDETISSLDTYDAVDVAVPAVDTIIELDAGKHFISSIPNRNFLNRGQTPQAFRYEIIKKAYERALADPAMQTTDDCGIVRKYLPDTPVFVVSGEEQNVKLTYPEDIYVLDKLFQLKNAVPDGELRPEQLAGKVMAVFGGNSGIGRDMISIAESYGAHGFAFSRSTTGTDISRRADVERALAEIAEKEGHVDYVVNTAAVLNREPLMHLSDDTVEKIIAINYSGMVHVTRAAYPYVRETGGQILHFTSSSYTRGRANYAMYSSSKAAVVNFVQALAEEWQGDGIRINCINPQRTKTPMRLANFGIEPEGTLLSSETVAKVALKTLLSDFSGNVVDVKVGQ